MRAEWPTGELVEFDRKPLDGDSLVGFVLRSSGQFTLIHYVDEMQFQLDGYRVLRNSDVRGWRVIDGASMLARALRVKRVRPAPLPWLTLGDWAALLKSAEAHFPMLVIHRESVAKGACQVGRLGAVGKSGFVLKEINPGAEWDGDSRYRFADLTLAGFGGRYEDALALVAEQSPKARKPHLLAPGRGVQPPWAAWPLVEFDRPLERRHLFGFVLDWSKRLTLIQYVDTNDFALDGYRVFRNRDIRRWREVRQDDVLMRALRLKRVRTKRIPGLNLESWSTVLETAGARFPLLAVHREVVNRRTFLLGRPRAATKSSFELEEIDMDGVWERVTRVKFADITVMDFGGRYEDAYARVSAREGRRRR